MRSRDTRRLLHVVGDDDDGVVLFQLPHSSSIFEVEMGSRALVGSSISSTSGSTAKRAGDAQALLLAAGKAQGILLQAVLHLVPDGRAAQELSTISSSLALLRTPCVRGP